MEKKQVPQNIGKKFEYLLSLVGGVKSSPWGLTKESVSLESACLFFFLDGVFLIKLQPTMHLSARGTWLFVSPWAKLIASHSTRSAIGKLFCFWDASNFEGIEEDSVSPEFSKWRLILLKLCNIVSSRLDFLWHPGFISAPGDENWPVDDVRRLCRKALRDELRREMLERDFFGHFLL